MWIWPRLFRDTHTSSGVAHGQHALFDKLSWTPSLLHLNSLPVWSHSLRNIFSPTIPTIISNNLLISISTRMFSGHHAPVCPNRAPTEHEKAYASPTALRCQLMETIFQDFRPKALEPTLTFFLFHTWHSDSQKAPLKWFSKYFQNLTTLTTLPLTPWSKPLSSLTWIIAAASDLSSSFHSRPLLSTHHSSQDKLIKTNVRSCQPSAWKLPMAS